MAVYPRYTYTMLNLLKPQHLTRYKDIAWLLFRHGRTDLVEAGGLASEVTDDVAPGDARAEELADDLEAMGPTFVKLGQVLASRADLLPPAYLEALGRLTDDVEPFPFDDVRSTIEQQLGITLSEWFAKIDHTPIAAASLGQVHRATLADGREVVLKVQRPEIRQRILDDVNALDEIARVIDGHTDFGRRYRVRDVLRQFKRTILEELDYEQEAENLQALRDNLAEFDNLIVPQPLPELTAPRVLTMQFVDCASLEDLTPEQRALLKGDALAEELFHAYLQQVLVDGFFHADPHPGNVKLASGDKLVLLDLGMTGRVPPRMQENLLRLLAAISEGRADDVVQVSLRIGIPTDDFEEADFTERITDLVAANQNQTVGGMRVGRLLMDIGQIAGDCNVRLPSQITTLGKMLMHLDTIGKLLDTDFDPNASIRRHSSEMMNKRMRANLSPGRLFSSILEGKDFLDRLPGRLDRILDNLAHNKLRVNVNAIDENRLIAGMQKIANRITAGLVLAALIIGAALMMNIDTTFTLLGYPTFALILFIAAAAFGFILVINIMFRDD